MFRNHLGSLDVIEDTEVVFVTMLTFNRAQCLVHVYPKSFNRLCDG